MSYWDFLRQWYNLVFLALAAVGVITAAVARMRGRDQLTLSAGTISAAVLGLTLNGAIHDLSLGSPAPRFPLVAAVSIAFGILFARAAKRFRDRHFRPIVGVTFNRPGFEGREARIVTRGAGPEPGSGRAQWQDEEGVLHVVHVHTSEDPLPFGRRVRLAAFDDVEQSYLVTPL